MTNDGIRVWKVDEINESYKQFIAQAKKSFKSKNNLHWVFTAKQLELEFKSIYCEDRICQQNFYLKTGQARQPISDTK